jgi:rSAM/selenodomain-associated transferase 2
MDADVVLGPALDGGYYLIGLKHPAPELFAGIPWGGADVLAETMHVAASRRLKSSLLSPLFDIDRQEDLALWRAEQVELSIVVPTLNEASHLARTLEAIGDLTDGEVVVVDGGSDDETATIAASHGARFVVALRGRARQMNWGAAMATGETLLFLHADTRLPGNYVEVIRETLSARNVAAGAFRLRIDGASVSERIIAGGANLRSRWLAAPYGDQGLFLKASLFRELGGFADLPLLEDLELVRRLRKRGRIAIAPAYATTSPRRWRKLGPWRTTWRNQRIAFDWLRGRPVEELAQRYRRA